MTRFSTNTEFTVIYCCHAGCGVAFAFTEDFEDRRRKDKQSFYCPNGHKQGFYGENEQERRLREAEQKAAREAAKAARAENRAKAVNRQYKRIRDRVKNGVCPCCNRTFENLANHMRTQHKDFGQHDLLKALRTAYGLTQTALAEEIWVNPAYVSLYENNKPLPEEAAHRIECWLLEQTA